MISSKKSPIFLVKKFLLPINLSTEQRLTQIEGLLKRTCDRG